jgi:hypothetical protein
MAAYMNINNMAGMWHIKRIQGLKYLAFFWPLCIHHTNYDLGLHSLRQYLDMIERLLPLQILSFPILTILSYKTRQASRI